jgi:hypothetical protein
MSVFTLFNIFISENNNNKTFNAEINVDKRLKYNLFSHQLVVTPPNDFKFTMREEDHERLWNKIDEEYIIARALSAIINNIIQSF